MHEYDRPGSGQWSLSDFAGLAGGWLWQSDDRFRISWLSESFEALYGSTRERCYGQPLAVLAAAGSECEHWQRVHAAFSTRHRFADLEVPFHAGRGLRWHLISAIPCCDHSGRFAGYRGVCRDITEQRTVRQQVEQTRRLFMQAVEWFEGSFAYYDGERRLVDCNDKYREVFTSLGLGHLLQPGVLYDDLVWAQIRSRKIKGSEGREQEAFRERMERFQRAEPFEFQLEDGRWQQAIDQRLPDGGTLALRLDITALHRSREEASSLQRQLADAIELFDGGVALFDAEERLVLCNKRYHNQLSVLGLTVKRGVSYHTLLHGVVQAEDGQLLGKARIEFTRLATQNNLSLRIKPCSVQVRSDAALLERMLGNLIGNAVRYTDQGRILVGCRRQGDFLLLGVWDTGIGIEDGDIEAIFEEFYQVHANSRGSSGGQGLGLAIVKHCAGLLDHPLIVQSAPAKGSCFGIRIPVCATG